MVIMQTKESPLCGETKPVSEFYISKRRRDGFLGVCKICHRIRSADAAKRRQERNYEALASTGELAEEMVVYELAKHGIPAQRRTRRTAGAIYTDVLAWGCVRIEVKSSGLQLAKGRYVYKFSFHPDNAAGENNADVIVLVTTDVNQHYVFPFEHPVFICKSNKYGRIGQRKVQLTYRPNARAYDSAEISLTEHLLNSFLNRWELVEHYRLRHSENLKHLTSQL